MGVFMLRLEKSDGCCWDCREVGPPKKKALFCSVCFGGCIYETEEGVLRKSNKFALLDGCACVY